MPKKTTWGGKRPGSGRPMTNTVRLRVTIKPKTAAILERVAKERGLVRRTGAPPFLGGAVDALAESASTKEPAYLRIAREASGGK